MNYQVDWGDGWRNCYPDGYGMHDTDCVDCECEGCWSPESGDTEVWFGAIFGQGAERARAGCEQYTSDEWEKLSA